MDTTLSAGARLVLLLESWSDESDSLSEHSTQLESCDNDR